MDPQRQVHVKCPAKVNLALSIGGPRPDGLHPIASWFVTIDLADDLTVMAATGQTRFEIEYAQDAPVPGVVDWPIEKDLGYKALRLLEETVGHSFPVRVSVQKRIPSGGGLGGGSSDAAGMLVAVNQLFSLGMGEEKLTALASRLGSDVPFFVSAWHGRPSAIVAGVGEVITAAPREESIDLTLILPGLQCPTGEVYRAFDAWRPAAPSPDIDRVAILAAESPLRNGSPFNDLAEPAMLVRPELRAIRDRAAALIGRTVHVSGSGSTLFAVADNASRAHAMATHVRERMGMAAQAVHT